MYHYVQIVRQEVRSFSGMFKITQEFHKSAINKIQLFTAISLEIFLKSHVEN